jgi:hypothetical protein
VGRDRVVLLPARLRRSFLVFGACGGTHGDRDGGPPIDASTPDIECNPLPATITFQADADAGDADCKQLCAARTLTSEASILLCQLDSDDGGVATYTCQYGLPC